MKTKLYTTILLLLALCLPAEGFGQAPIANYVRTKTMTVANGSTYLDQIDYIGGDGKKYHTAYKGITPSGKNLLTFRVYNSMGKESKNWLPIEYSSDFASGYLFDMNDASYYNGDTRPFSETVYESSAVGRVTAEYGPGQAWTNNPVRYDYGTNTSSGVLSLIRYTVGSNYALTANGTVPAGTLNVTKVTDEDGHEAYSFTDQLGRTLLERQVSGSEWLDTYYVYDSYGRLCYVLQPMYQSEADLSKYAYRYEYDSRGRCTKKTLPGAEYVLYEYDANDRVIYSQDGNQRAAGKWQCYTYDSAGRLKISSESTSKPMIFLSGDIVNHYDEYDFLSGTGSFINSAWPNMYVEAVAKYAGKGQLTGSEVKVIGSNTTIRTVYYYNPDGLLRKQVENNLLGGFDTYEYTYTFTKQPATMTHTHTASGKPTQTEVVTFTYDHGERLTKVTHKLNNGTEVAIAEYTYDKYGRVATKKMHGNDVNSTNYAYNIRGWVVDVFHPYIRQQLTYNNGTAGFNGNITKMTWRTANNSEQNYSFTYDGANRMLDAIYSESYSMNQNVDRYTEKVTEYDKNGNIKKLQRYGQTGSSTFGLVDNLTYTYNGNKVTRVDDATTATSYTGGTNFVNGANTNNEYVYDQNGNLTKDLNKNITDIQYNSLNLPSVLTFSDGSTITYTYTYDGKKLRTVHVIGSTTTTTDYCGNVIYENGTAKRLLTDEGYVDLTTNTYYYYMKDHQGNNRAVVNSSGIVQETNHYYPFGGLFSTSTNEQPYKYNGKELDTKKGLNLYDYGARQYDAALGRWHIVDPMAEKYYNLTPYAFTGNHGSNALELDGGLFIFVNGYNMIEVAGHYAYYMQRNSSSPYGPIPMYNPSRDFKNFDFYGWKNVDKLYMEHYKDANAVYINGSFGDFTRASVRYNRGMESGRELLEKLRSGELTLGKDETIKIVGYSMGGAYAAGMANALMQDSDYAHLLQFVDYLAPHQPTSFEHPEGVLGRQFASDKDWFTTYKAINNISFRKVEHFGSLLDFGAHLLSDDFYDFLMNCFNNGVPIYYGD